MAVVPGTSYTVTIGAGGVGVTGDTAGNAGSDSWFSSAATVLAKGGSGGGSSTVDGAGGIGGLASGSVGDLTLNGGTGGTGAGAGGFGGGGGGAAGNRVAGNAGGNAGAADGIGGIGGDKGGGNGTPGVDISGTSLVGRTPGGGSGGGSGGTTSGTGGSGRVTLTYTTQGLISSSAALVNLFTNPNYMQVQGEDGDYFIQYGSEYVISEFKYTHINSADDIYITWTGRTTEAPNVSPVFLQIYNVNSAAWETLASNTVSPADTDFTFMVKQSTNVSNYYATGNIVTARVYQLVI